jgi:hypothetical protein
MKDLVILHKINYYIHNTKKPIQHPIYLNKSGILISTHSILKMIELNNVDVNSIDDITDICFIDYIDRLL